MVSLAPLHACSAVLQLPTFGNNGGLNLRSGGDSSSGNASGGGARVNQVCSPKAAS